MATVNTGDSVTVTSSQKRGGYLHVRTGSGQTGWLWARNVGATQGSAHFMAKSASVAPRQRFGQSCSDPQFPSSTATPIDSACGAEGIGEDEANQNLEKNNFCAPGPAKLMTISQMVSLQKQVQKDGSIPFGQKGPNTKHPLSSEPGPATNRGPLEALGEGTEVALVGYVALARKEGAEKVNCSHNVPDDDVYHDIHISIVPKPGGAECSGIVAEMIPHHRPDTWTPELVNEVSKANAMVRVTGNLMFDSSHSPCIHGSAIGGDPSRASLWEVHPIYKFEVCSTGDCGGENGWVDLDSWSNQQ